MMRVKVLFVCVLAGHFGHGSLAAGEDDVLVQGPPQIGNGLPNGGGATLGRMFLRLDGLGEAGALELRLDLLLTSGLVSVDPITCSAPSPRPCSAPGVGEAGVLGYPTTTASVTPVNILKLKLAAAQYLPTRLPAGLAGSSLEFALEGALSLEGTEVGSLGRLRLLLGEMPNILAWGVDALRPPENRPYDNNTGTGVLLGDRRALFFPGTINCEVVEHGDNALFLKLVAADLVTVDPTNDTSHAAIRPDFAAAEAAGLPAGAFGLLEINTTGRPSLSRVFPPAASNDVEIHLTAVPRPPGRGFLRGDCNADGTATGSVTDAVFMLLFNFSGGDRPSCLDACDANGDGRVLGEVTDAIYLLTFNFLGGPSPPPPFPGCGAGEETKLGCESYPPCEG